MEELKKTLNLKKDIDNKTLSFEMKLIEKSEYLVELGYNFAYDNTFDIILNFGGYGMGSPGYNFPTPNAKKLKITVEIITSDIKEPVGD